MSTLCGWASQSENRSITGQAGDQTGWEVKTGPWYPFGQTEVFRWKDRELAKKYAGVIKYWCNGNYVGYDQYQRTTLGAWCKAHKWDYHVNKKVETDCSRMVADGINCTLGKELFSLGSTFYTGNLKDRLMATGLFTRLTGSKYCGSSDYLMVGDIINNPRAHVITCLANGPKVTKAATTTKTSGSDLVKTGQKGLNKLLGGKLVIDGKRTPATKKLEVMAVQYGLNKTYGSALAVDGTFATKTKGVLSRHWVQYGDDNMLVRAVQCLLYTHAYNPKGIDGHFGPGMLAAVKAYQKKAGLTVDGIAGPKTITRLISS